MKEKPPKNSGGVGRLEDFGKSENFGDSNNSEGSGDSGDFGRFGEIGRIGRFGRLGKIVIRGKRLVTPWKPEELRVLGVWGIRKMGKFRRLGDCEIWEIGGLGKIFLRGEK